MKNITNKPIKWVIQKNLLNENCLQQMIHSLINNNIDYQEVDVIPFSNEVIELDMNYFNIIYGSVSFVEKLRNKYGEEIGVFYNESNFSMENYINKWGDYMLNSDAFITTLNEFLSQSHEDDSLWFVRPDGDNKAFDGQVRTFAELKNWENNLQTCDNVSLNNDTKIIVSKPYSIAKEWRLYIVDNEVVTGSRYREYFKLSKSATDIPQEMIDFAKDRIKEYQPDDVFCMDIAYCGDSYYIIECGCINSCGFYSASINDVITSITNYCKTNQT